MKHIHLLLFSTVALHAAKPFFEESTVWKNKEDGLWPHHVYALVATPKDTVLAVAEGRIEPGDDAAHHILLKRSTDRGKTWSEDIRLETANGEFNKTSGASGLENWANPSAVVDPKTGEAFVFYVLNEGAHDQSTSRVFYKSSRDDGQTWNQRVELTSVFKQNKQGWPFFMPGPGHGIALARQKDKSKSGRLVVPFWCRQKVTAPQRQYGVVALISDDHGASWKLGGIAGMEHGMNESRIAELADGRLMLNGRGSDPQHNGTKTDSRRLRVYAVSQDGGDTFAPSTTSSNPQTAQVDSSMVSYPLKGGKRALLFAYPAGRPGEGPTDTSGKKRVPTANPDNLYPISRSNIKVAVSLDEAKTWPHQKAIYAEGACYSDLVVFRDGTIGLLYGKDRENDVYWNRAFPQSVAFAHFNYEYLTEGDKK